jgi:hypothetical protein
MRMKAMYDTCPDCKTNDMVLSMSTGGTQTLWLYQMPKLSASFVSAWGESEVEEIC